MINRIIVESLWGERILNEIVAGHIHRAVIKTFHLNGTSLYSGIGERLSHAGTWLRQSRQ